MKTIKILFPLFLFFQMWGFSQNVETRIVDDFNKIYVWGNIKVEAKKGDESTVQIDAGNIPLDEVVTSTKKGKLIIKMKSNLFKDVVVNVKITYKEITEIYANASAEIKFIDLIKANEINIKSYSGARVILNVDLYKADLTASQGAQIDIKGKAGYMNSYAASGGVLSATNLITDEVKIKLNTGGKAEITVVKKLVAKINTKSSLSYFGKPETEMIKKSLGGNVSKWDE